MIQIEKARTIGEYEDPPHGSEKNLLNGNAKISGMNQFGGRKKRELHKNGNAEIFRQF